MDTLNRIVTICLRTPRKSHKAVIKGCYLIFVDGGGGLKQAVDHAGISGGGLGVSVLGVVILDVRGSDEGPPQMREDALKTGRGDESFKV